MMKHKIKDGFITIRPIQHTDVEALIQLAERSFAEEFAIQGISPENFARQARFLMRGRMIPFHLVKMLTGIEWEVLIAEEGNKMVGCAGYVGREQVELGYLMVQPEHRRRGIAQTLIQRCLEMVKAEGYKWVTGSILQHNEASLGNALKLGGERLDAYQALEKPIGSKPRMALGCRPIQPTDKPIFQAMEKQYVDPERVKVLGSAVDTYFPTWREQLMDRLSKQQSERWIFSDREETIGFLAAFTSPYQTKGSLGRPITTTPEYIPAMLAKGEGWLASLGKTAVRTTIASHQTDTIAQLQEQGWQTKESWVRLVKYF